MHIYLASSWKNVERFEAVLARLKSDGHTVFDYRVEGFLWSDVLSSQTPSAEEYERAFVRPEVDSAFQRDVHALKAADALVMVMPCGRSAHLELGFAAGRGIPTAIYLDDPVSAPETMHALADCYSSNLDEIVDFLRVEESKLLGRMFNRGREDVRPAPRVEGHGGAIARPIESESELNKRLREVRAKMFDFEQAVGFYGDELRRQLYALRCDYGLYGGAAVSRLKTRSAGTPTR